MRFDVRGRRFCFDSLRFPLPARLRRTLTTTIPRENVEAADVARQPGLPVRLDPAVQCAREAVGGKPAGSRSCLVYGGRRRNSVAATVLTFEIHFSGTGMPKQTTPKSATPVRQNDYVDLQKSRAQALKRADIERAEKRAENDARINVNASKWRYICQEG
ncbi:hypothetical protein [Burkholderia stabilis]|uniref:hypothetical protein n=1 Tax=Burkholderia stabilis TaxID=95485 RepID=UPI003B98501F